MYKPLKDWPLSRTTSRRVQIIEQYTSTQALFSHSSLLCNYSQVSQVSCFHVLSF
jgi:hypothetical protein